MGITTKSFDKSKFAPVKMKEPNPARLHMPREQAIEENRKLKAIQDKVAEFQKKLEAEELGKQEIAVEEGNPIVKRKKKTE